MDTEKCCGNRVLLDTFLANRPALVDRASALLNCRERAEDVAQDIYLKLCEHPPSGSIRQPLGYLYRMVRNLCIDHLRRQQWEVRHSVDQDSIWELPASSPSPETNTLQRKLLEQLSSALSELPVRTRKVFEMTQVDGHTQREAAREVGASPTLINFLLRDALGHCRQRLGV